METGARRGGWRAEAAATLRLAWPMALTNLSQMGMLATDAALLGRVSGEAVAAVTLLGALFWAVLAPCLGLSFAAAALLARERGRRAGAVRAMRRTVAAGAWCGALAAVPGMVLLWHADDALRALGQDPALAALARDYARALLWGVPFFALFLVLRGFMAAMERPGPPLVVGLLALPLNGLVGWALIFGAGGLPPLGVVGAGLASTLSNAFLALALLVHVSRDGRLRRFRLASGLWRPEAARLAAVLRLGLPVTGQLLLEVGLFSAAGLVMGGFGSSAVAAHAVAMSLASLTFAVPLGLSQAATARVGLAAGAGDAEAARRAGWTAIGLGAGFMGGAAALMWLAPGPLVRVFLDPAVPGGAEAAALAATLLGLAALFQLGDGVQVVAAGALRGLHDARAPMVIAGLGYWGVGFASAVALGPWLGLGPVGVWLGLVFGLSAVALALTARWALLSRRPLAVPSRLSPLAA